MEKSWREIIDNVVVPHTQFNTAWEALEELFKEAQNTSKPEGLTITGSTGVGKTVLKERFLRMHPWYDTADRSIFPVLSFSLPTRATPKAVYQSALSSLGYQYVSGTESALFARLTTLLTNCGVKLIYVDEAQHLIEHGGKKTHMNAGDSLKAIMEEAKVNMVLTGTPRLNQLMIANDQLRRRFSTHIRLRDWQPDCQQDLSEVAGVMQALFRRSGTLGNFNSLLNPAFTMRLIYASGGRISYISKLVSSVAQYAREDEDAGISQQHFEDMFVAKIWPDACKKTNPFSKKFVDRKLNRRDEPFWEAP